MCPKAYSWDSSWDQKKATDVRAPCIKTHKKRHGILTCDSFQSFLRLYLRSFVPSVIPAKLCYFCFWETSASISFHLLISISVTPVQCCQPCPEGTGEPEVFLQLELAKIKNKKCTDKIPNWLCSPREQPGRPLQQKPPHWRQQTWSQGDQPGQGHVITSQSRNTLQRAFASSFISPFDHLHILSTSICTSGESQVKLHVKKLSKASSFYKQPAGKCFLEVPLSKPWQNTEPYDLQSSVLDSHTLLKSYTHKTEALKKKKNSYRECWSHDLRSKSGLNWQVRKTETREGVRVSEIQQGLSAGQLRVGNMYAISQSTKWTTTQLRQVSLSVADLISAWSLPPTANLAHQTANPTNIGWERLGDSYPRWAPSTSGYRASLKFIFSQLRVWPLHQNHGAASLPWRPAALPPATRSNFSLLWVGA